MLLNYTVFPYLPRIINKPVLMIVTEEDNITLWDLEVDVFHRIPSSVKQVEILPAVSHMSLYSEERDTNIAARLSANWFGEHLGKR